jgi:hypothetical protein
MPKYLSILWPLLENSRLIVKNLLCLLIGLMAAATLAQEYNLKPIATLSDEFNQPRNLLEQPGRGSWQLLNPSAIDIAVIDKGKLVIKPKGYSRNSWYNDDAGSMIYKVIEGNFAVKIKLRVSSFNDPTQPPKMGFNSAGLGVRDVASKQLGGRDENWLMFNIGTQSDFYGREIKTTWESSSRMQQTEDNDMEKEMLICRIGPEFYYYYRRNQADSWSAETINQYHQSHPYFGNRVQVGILSNTWSGSDDVKVVVDYIRFSRVHNKAECIVD